MLRFVVVILDWSTDIVRFTFHCVVSVSRVTTSVYPSILLRQTHTRTAP